jgi:hypothetical protein
MTIHDFLAYKELWYYGKQVLDKIGSDEVRKAMTKQLIEYEIAVSKIDNKTLIDIFAHIFITNDNTSMKFLNAVQQHIKQVNYR